MPTPYLLCQFLKLSEPQLPNVICWNFSNGRALKHPTRRYLAGINFISRKLGDIKMLKVIWGTLSSAAGRAWLFPEGQHGWREHHEQADDRKRLVSGDSSRIIPSNLLPSIAFSYTVSGQMLSIPLFLATNVFYLMSSDLQPCLHISITQTDWLGRMTAWVNHAINSISLFH